MARAGGKLKLRGWCLSLVLAACTTPEGEPTLDLSMSPSQLDAFGRTGTVKVVATNGDGTIGVGSVKLATTPGELDATEFELDTFGTAKTVLTCLATDSLCVQGATIDLDATWRLTDGGIVRARKGVSIARAGSTQSSSWSRDNCPPEAKLIYLFTDAQALFSFHPPTRALVSLGRLQCPVTNGATPNSMAVGQDAVAWVGFSDGSMFRVNVRTLGCTATNFTPPAGFTRYGMGFAPDSETSPVESLFISHQNGLARVDTQTMAATVIGPFTGQFAGRGAELTGLPNGQLYGFFLPPAGGGMQLAELEKTSAATTLRKDFPTLTISQSSFAYAFSSWGSDFYLYTSSDGAPTTVTKYATATDSVSTYLIAPTGVRILGAGVSRCGGD